MSIMQNEQNTNNADRQTQAGALLAGLFTLIGLALAAFSSYAVIQQGGRLELADGVLLPFAYGMFFANLAALVLIRRGRQTLGVWVVYLVGVILFPTIATLMLRQVYLVTGLSVALFSALFLVEAFPPRARVRAAVFAAAALIGIAGIEIWDPGFREVSDFNATDFGAGVAALAGLTAIIYFLPRLLGGNIRLKITSGILMTGTISLAILSIFAFTRAARLVGTLSGQIENAVTLLAQEQLINTVEDEAGAASATFSETVFQIQGLASQLELLHKQRDALGSGEYWNAEERLLRYSAGQYTNTLNSPSSVFVPSFVSLDEEVVKDLNTNVHLDFSTPFLLASNSQLNAVYFTDRRGVVIYYPNISFSANVPPDYDARAQPAYKIATPLFDPHKEPRWSFPRRDPAGVGLIVSVSVPVYFDDEFNGVITADFRLRSVAENIQAITVGQTGYAFLIDSDGHIIAMPPEGYEFFGMQPEILEAGQEPQQTLLDSDSVPEAVQQILNRMVVGGSGLVTTRINETDYFITYAPVANRTFSLGLVVPVEELTQPVIATRNEIAAQQQVTIRNIAVILLLLLAGAVLVSLGLGQVISAPIQRLTETANQILEGDLSAQAQVTTRDEIGTLAQAFNAMTARLRATFEGLEQNIEERTAQLVEANANIERRARQFQSIAQVARTISSTLDLDSLLNQITTAISREFGFYHVGVFLLDRAGEYAVLSAANSEGGQMMLARGHRLKVGGQGMVGFVSNTGKPRIALDTGADAVFFNNPDLPNTRSEIALPLRSGDQIVGVLDVQSTEANAFSEEDVAILTTLADQVSIAIQNARQNEETNKALAEARALSRQFVQSGWQEFTKRQKLLGVRHSGARATLLYDKKAGAKNEGLPGTSQLKAKGRGAVLSLPIKLRGEVIGSVDVRAPDNRQWEKDELDIVAAIIERAAIAMENARLLAESQKRAAKERTIGEIAAKISAQSEVEELLKTAALELNRSLPGTEVAIQFKREEAE